VIDLEKLRSIAEEHGVELQTTPHPNQSSVVFGIRKDGAAVSSEIDVFSCLSKATDGTTAAEVVLVKMIERLEEFLDGRAGESGQSPGER